MSVLLTLGCGKGAVNFMDVVSIQAGDGAGTALSGNFAVVLEVTSDGCASVSALEIPAVGTKTPVDVEVEQENGSITFKEIEEMDLAGAVDFESQFEAGGASIISRDGEKNILRMIHVKGSFQDADTFSATGDERLTGRIRQEDVDCTFSVGISGVRKAS